MMNTKLVFVWWLLLSLANVVLASDANSSFTMVKAWPKDGYVEFELQSPTIDWKILSGSKYINLEGKKVTSDLRELMGGNDCPYSACFSFYSPMKKEIKKDYFYLISSHRIENLELERLRGVVSYGLSTSYDYFEGEPSYHGFVNGKVKDRKAEFGGFIIISKTPLQFDFTDTPTIDPKKYPIISEWDTKKDLGRNSENFWKVVNSFGFRIKGISDEYVFVQWRPDQECIGACCEFRFSLLTLGESPHEVISNNYSCDI